MSQEPQAELKNFQSQYKYFVGIDSDGCAFNSMEVKHNDSFSVNLIKHFGLAAISRQVHQVWDFVNLYSKTRHHRVSSAPLSELVSSHSQENCESENG